VNTYVQTRSMESRMYSKQHPLRKFPLPNNNGAEVEEVKIRFEPRTLADLAGCTLVVEQHHKKLDSLPQVFKRTLVLKILDDQSIWIQKSLGQPNPIKSSIQLRRTLERNGTVNEPLAFEKLLFDRKLELVRDIHRMKDSYLIDCHLAFTLRRCISFVKLVHNLVQQWAEVWFNRAHIDSL